MSHDPGCVSGPGFKFCVNDCPHLLEPITANQGVPAAELDRLREQVKALANERDDLKRQLGEFKPGTSAKTRRIAGETAVVYVQPGSESGYALMELTADGHEYNFRWSVEELKKLFHELEHLGILHK